MSGNSQTFPLKAEELECIFIGRSSLESDPVSFCNIHSTNTSRLSVCQTSNVPRDPEMSPN